MAAVLSTIFDTSNENYEMSFGIEDSSPNV